MSKTIAVFVVSLHLCACAADDGTHVPQVEDDQGEGGAGGVAGLGNVDPGNVGGNRMNTGGRAVDADAAAPTADAEPTAKSDAGAQDAQAPLFMAVGNGGYRAWSSDGTSWKDAWLTDGRVVESKENFRGVGFGGGQFLAVGGAFGSNILMRSADGLTWENVAAPGLGGLYSAAYLKGVWVISGGGADLGFSDDEGKSWKKTGKPVGAHFRLLSAGNNVFVAAGNSWDQKARGVSTASGDFGRTWSQVRYTDDGEIRGIAFGAGVFVTVSRRSCELSNDGVTWRDCGAHPNSDNRGVHFVNNEFVIVSSSGGKALRSADGLNNWQVTPGDVPAGDLAYAGGTYVLVGWGTRFFSKQLGSFKQLPGTFRATGRMVSNAQ